MRSLRIGLGVLVLVLGLGLFADGSSATAQDAGFSDPFFLYYGFFLPRQNALASQSQPEDFYRVQAATRQYSAPTDRAGLYDASSAIGLEELDPYRAFGTRSGSTRMTRTVPTGLPSSIARLGHAAPRSHFGDHGSYFPSRRAGSPSRRSPAVSAGIMPSPGVRGMPNPMNVGIPLR